MHWPGMIVTNKWLMLHGVPYPLLLTSMGQLTSIIFVSILIRCVASAAAAQGVAALLVAQLPDRRVGTGVRLWLRQGVACSSR